MHELARKLPGQWVHELRPLKLEGQMMGVDLYSPVTSYTVTDRGIKYGLLFISLTFLTYLCFELTVQVRLHMVQYAVISLGLVLFYLVLLAASDHLRFGISYLLATVLIVGMLGTYTWAMLRMRSLMALVVVVLGALYTGLYTLLQLESMALVMGTLLLVAGLAALMYATRLLHELE